MTVITQELLQKNGEGRGNSLSKKTTGQKIDAALIKLGDQVGQNSLKASVADIATSGKTTGWRASEHSQTKLHEVGYHKYPSGKEAMKAINDNGVIFSDKNGIFFT